MALIDPEGLFHGDRLRKCSDMARLCWPYLFLGANGHGRLQLDYEAIKARVFFCFKNAPTLDQLWGYIQEYSDNRLIFLYKSGNQRWGQFYCKPGSLPRWRTKKDNESPAPPEPDYELWIKTHVNDTEVLQKLSEDLIKLSSGIGNGVGVGYGLGVGKNHSSPALPDDGAPVAFALEDLLPENTVLERQQTFSEIQESWFYQEFWPICWRKVDKIKALKAFQKHARTVELKDKIIAAANEHSPFYHLREPEKRPHAATWLNGRRYEEPFDGSAPQMQFERLTKHEINHAEASRRFRAEMENKSE